MTSGIIWCGCDVSTRIAVSWAIVQARQNRPIAGMATVVYRVACPRNLDDQQRGNALGQARLAEEFGATGESVVQGDGVQNDARAAEIPG